MNKDQISLGAVYQCTTPFLQEAFLGTVIAVYDNSCVIELQNCAAHDSRIALEYNNRFVISFADLVP